MALATFSTVHATSLESWVGGNEFRQYRLIESKNIEGNYFAVFRSGSEIVVASRKLVENGSTGGHRVKVELRGSDGTNIVANGACPKREVKSTTALCGNKFCQSNTDAYLVAPDDHETLNYMVRWQWITANVPDAKQMRNYIQQYLEENELPVILEGQVMWK